jgi:hypothetical protein
MKPGNRVEEKTLTTEPQRRESLDAVKTGDPDGEEAMVELGPRGATERAPVGNSPPTVTLSLDLSDRCGNKIPLTTGKTRTPRPRHRGVGSRGREARMTTLESRHREGSEQPENGMGMARSTQTPRRSIAEVRSHSGWGQGDPPFPTISNARPSRRMTRCKLTE